MEIFDKRAEKICLKDKRERTCTFLGFGADRRPQCLKNTELACELVRRRMVRDVVAMGDNCSGPPHFRRPLTPLPVGNISNIFVFPKSIQTP